MADLRDFRGVLEAFTGSNAKSTSSKSYSKKSAPYRRIVCTGSEWSKLILRHSLISNFEHASDMSFDVTAATKDRAWRVKRESFGDVHGLVSAMNGSDSSAKNSIQDFFAKLLLSAENGTDPRAPFDEEASKSNFQQSLECYDATIADMLSPVFFHYAFETLRPAMMSGFSVDAQIEWRHGGWIHDGSPRAFGYVDDNVKFFAPQTQALCMATLYRPEKPHLRRYLAACAESPTNAAHDAFMASVETATQALTKAQGYAPLAFCDKNVDRWILMPSAVVSLVHAIIDAIHRIKFDDESFDASFLSPDLELRCNPYHCAFGKDGGQKRKRRSYLVDGDDAMDMAEIDNYRAGSAANSGANVARRATGVVVDARGQVTQSISIIKNSEWGEFPKTHASEYRSQMPQTAPNGHAVDETGSMARVFCPVLSGTDGDADAIAPWTGEGVSQMHRGKICCIERLGAYLSPSGDIRVVVPNGGILFQDGDCLGHITAPMREFELSDWLAKARAISAPMRIGGIAAAMLEVEPNL